MVASGCMRSSAGSRRTPARSRQIVRRARVVKFARRFFRTFFRKLNRIGLLVIDDLHYGVETAQFRTMLAIMLRELPDDLQCACISRTLPPDELGELTFKGRLTALDQSILQFSDAEARTLVASRSRRRSSAVDISAARGWAAGLVL